MSHHEVTVDVCDLDALLRKAADNCTWTSEERPSFRRLVTAVSEGLDSDIRMLSHGPRKIEAIKVWRTFTKEGLKEAKEAVESCPVHVPHPPAFTKKNRGEFVRELRAIGAKVK